MFYYYSLVVSKNWSLPNSCPIFVMQVATPQRSLEGGPKGPVREPGVWRDTCSENACWEHATSHRGGGLPRPVCGAPGKYTWHPWDLPIEFTPLLQHHLGLVPGHDAYQQEPLGPLHYSFVHGQTDPESFKEKPKPRTLPYQRPPRTSEEKKNGARWGRTTRDTPTEGSEVRLRTHPLQ